MARGALRARAELPVGVKRLRERIERWRKTRSRRTAMPAELWTEAMALARSGPKFSIARALGISFEVLRRRMAEAAAGDAEAKPGAFVEVSGAQLLGVTPEPGTIVEMSDGAGVRVTVRMAPGAEVDLAGLVTALKRHRA